MTCASDEPIRLSLSEIDALGRKAARGTGCSWGLAEEAGKSARWLAGYGLAGPEALAALFTAPRRCGCTSDSAAPLCPIAAGADLSDSAEEIADGTDMRLGDVAEPLLLLAQASRSAHALKVILTLRWSGFCATCFPSGLSIENGDGMNDAVGRYVVCSNKNAVTEEADLQAGAASRLVSRSAYETLSRLASKTYAPATDASRNSGAGAGTRDND